MFPKWFNGDQVFLTPSWTFFVEMLDNAILRRSQSQEVSLFHSFPIIWYLDIHNFDQIYVELEFLTLREMKETNRFRILVRLNSFKSISS